MMVGRWSDAIQHRGDQVQGFLTHYFGKGGRRTLLLAGAGFDPRSSMVAEALGSTTGDGLEAIFIREERPEPDLELRPRADANHEHLTRLVETHETVPTDAFAIDGAPVLGRNVVEVLRGVDLSRYTDVVLDLSALSIGASFPMAAFVYEVVRSTNANLHLMVAANAEVDEMIRPVASDIVAPIHGFRGEWNTAATEDAAKLWMPQLAEGQNTLLERIRRHVEPDDVAPILPFPARHPRVGDQLIAAFQEELRETWEVGARDLVYAEENNPLDLYRTIIAIQDRRRPVFEEVGGSLLILSPVGSKVQAMGAMMAAMDRGLPVLYAEAVGYEADFHKIAEGDYVERTTELVHVWLHADFYAEGPLGRTPEESA